MNTASPAFGSGDSARFFAQFFQGKIGLRLLSRRAPYAHVSTQLIHKDEDIKI